MFGPRRILSTLALVIAISICIPLFAAYGSGWSELASRFSYEGAPPPELLKSDTIFLYRPGGSLFSLRGSVRTGLTTEGIYLAQSGLFRMFSRPLLIPWSEMKGYSLTCWGGGEIDTNIVTSTGIEVTIPDSAKTVLVEAERRHIPQANAH